MQKKQTEKQTKKQKKYFLVYGLKKSERKKSLYLGEIGHKVKQEKRGKLQTPKGTSFFAKNRDFGFLRSAGQMNSKGFLKSQNHRNSFKKQKLFFKKKSWYMDKAAPIPGGNQKLSMGFVKKYKKFNKNTLLAYKELNKFLFVFNKKMTKKQYRKTNRDIRSSLDFSALMQMDSLFHGCMRKAAFQLKPQEKNMTCSYFLNGKNARKKNFVLYRSTKAIQKDGDFCIGPFSE